jgi:hypothetical protein
LALPVMVSLPVPPVKLLMLLMMSVLPPTPETLPTPPMLPLPTTSLPVPSVTVKPAIWVL